MELEKKFDVACPRETAIEVAGEDDTLQHLFPEAKTEVEHGRDGRRTAVTHYTALGREGTATFHFEQDAEGNLHFEKVCDGNVWRQLSGTLRFVTRRKGTRVVISMEGRTKSLVPEFTIKGPMKDQIDQMAEGLRELLEARA